MAFFVDRGFQQVTSVSFGLRIPHTDAAVNLETTLDPSGRARYSVYGGDFIRSPLAFPGTGPQQSHRGSAGKFLIRGIVVNDVGVPIEGAAVQLGKDTVISDSKGVFLLRVCRERKLAVHVLPEEFACPGVWRVVSAPPIATPGMHAAGSEITNPLFFTYLGFRQLCFLGEAQSQLAYKHRWIELLEFRDADLRATS